MKWQVESAEGMTNAGEKKIDVLYIKCAPEDFVVDEIGLDGESAMQSFAALRTPLDFGPEVDEEEEEEVIDRCTKELEEVISEERARSLRALNEEVRLSYDNGEEIDVSEIELALAVEKSERTEMYRALDELVFVRITRKEEKVFCGSETRLKGLCSAEDAERVLRLAKSRKKDQVSIKAPKTKSERRALHGVLYEFRGLASETSVDKEEIVISCLGKKRKRKVEHTLVRCVMMKNNAEGLETMRRVTKNLGLQNNGFTSAGIKDKRAVTYQFCVIDANSKNARHILKKNTTLNWQNIQLAPLTRVDTPMQLGALSANAFRILARVDEKYRGQMWPSEISFLNFFGSQRVGEASDPYASWRVGRALLQGNYAEALILLVRRDKPDFPSSLTLEVAKKTARSLRRGSPVAQALSAYARFGDAQKAMDAVPFKSRTIWLHAYQSRLFNVSASSLTTSSIQSLPLVGANTPPEHEQQIRLLHDDKISLEDFRREKCNGARRPLYATATHLEVRKIAASPAAQNDEEFHLPVLEFTFRLPPGSFATVFLASLCRELRVVSAS